MRQKNALQEILDLRAETGLTVDLRRTKEPKAPEVWKTSTQENWLWYRLRSNTKPIVAPVDTVLRTCERNLLPSNAVTSSPCDQDGHVSHFLYLHLIPQFAVLVSHDLTPS